MRGRDVIEPAMRADSKLASPTARVDSKLASPMARVDQPEVVLAALVLAHGAGAPMDSPFMEAIAAGLCACGIRVVRFEFPYMAARRRTQKRSPPDRMPVLEASFRAVIGSQPSDVPLFIGGKSMGGRVATMLVDAADLRGSLAGAVALGYPFHPPGRADTLRIEHLRACSARCLIVQGTRDTFGTEPEVASYGLPTNVRVHWIADGDHSLEPRKASGRTSAQNLAEAIDVAAQFMLQKPGRKRRD